MDKKMNDSDVKSGNEKSLSGVFTKKKPLKFWSIVANSALVGILLSLIYTWIISYKHGYVSRDSFVQTSIFWILPAIIFFALYFISMIAMTWILITKSQATIIITSDGSRIQLKGLFSKTRTLDITGWKTYQITQHSRHRKETFFVLEVATENGSFMFADNMKNQESQNLAKIEGGDETIRLLSENNKSAYEMAKLLGLIDKASDAKVKNE